MERNKRNLVSWDYRILHSTGDKVPKIRKNWGKEGESSNNSKMAEDKTTLSENVKNLLENEEEIQDEISEFLSENQAADALSVEEIDENISEIKDLRKVFKRVHRQMKYVFENYENEHKIRLENNLERITYYLANAKIEKKNRFQNLETQKLLEKNEERQLLEEKKIAAKDARAAEEGRISDIKYKEINEKIIRIEKLCELTDCLEDDEVLDLKCNLSNIDTELRDLRNMCDKFENLVSKFFKREYIMKDLAAKYSVINETVLKYKNKLKDEVKKRELEDYKLKALAKLNIQIPKFAGYDHKIDIYSFQMKFEEEHARLPKSKCLYQLKEKFLIGPAKVSRRYR